MSRQPPKPVMSIEERRKRVFRTPGPGSYKSESMLSKRAHAIPKQKRNYGGPKSVAPGPKYLPDDSLIRKSSPKSKIGTQTRFKPTKTNCPTISYQDGTTQCLKRPSSRFTKQRRFRESKKTYMLTPGPQYSQDVAVVKRNTKNGSVFGVDGTKRFGSNKATSPKHAYLGSGYMVDKPRTTAAPIGKEKRGRPSSKDVTPGAKYSPDYSKDSRKKSSPKAVWGWQTNPRFI